MIEVVASFKGSCLQDATGRYHNKKDSTYGTPGVGFDSVKHDQKSKKKQGLTGGSRERPVEEILY